MGQDQSRQEKFFDACSYGREWLVKEMIAEGIDVNWKSSIHDCCPIHAASQGKPGIVRLLIQAQCVVDARDISGNTALHHAAMSGHVECVKVLLEAGASVNVSNNQFWTPLTNAAYWNQPEVIKLLLERGADPFWKNKAGRNTLHELCRSKSEKKDDLVICLRLLVTRMRELEIVFHSEKTKAVTQNGHPGSVTPGEAGKMQHRQVIMLTDWIPLKPGDSSLELRSSPTNAWDSEADFTPLIFASYHGNCSLVHTLLEMGADINSVDKNGWTSLHWAAQQNRVDVTCILLRNGANRRAKDCHGHMPYEVTTHPEMSEALRPDAFYPQIETNGPVSTDEEDASASESSSDEVDGGGRKTGAIPSYHYLRRLNYNNHRHRHPNHLRNPLPPSVGTPARARLARDDEDGCLGAAKA
ncbi:ankyrin repeat containing [Echinococcus multilocularis]|uniref:Ankyrin repeat containing n=1 Tax=Echinococcus multilocularis TaxID=6211 RepID=A0A068YMU4_ECHMU|nr:ankyrin repeat containing [Echinococcus multilocularis]